MVIFLRFTVIAHLKGKSIYTVKVFGTFERASIRVRTCVFKLVSKRQTKKTKHKTRASIKYRQQQYNICGRKAHQLSTHSSKTESDLKPIVHSVARSACYKCILRINKCMLYKMKQMGWQIVNESIRTKSGKMYHGPTVLIWLLMSATRIGRSNNVFLPMINYRNNYPSSTKSHLTSRKSEKQTNYLLCNYS